jgi:adenylate kinase
VVRDDDKPETVLNRLRVYREKTAPLVEYYKKKGLLKVVDGSGDLRTVQIRLRKMVGL